MANCIVLKQQEPEPLTWGPGSPFSPLCPWRPGWPCNRQSRHLVGHALYRSRSEFMIWSISVPRIFSVTLLIRLLLLRKGGRGGNEGQRERGSWGGGERGEKGEEREREREREVREGRRERGWRKRQRERERGGGEEDSVKERGGEGWRKRQRGREGWGGGGGGGGSWAYLRKGLTAT